MSCALERAQDAIYHRNKGNLVTVRLKKQKEGRMDDKNVCKKAFVMSVLCIFSIIILAILVIFVGG